ncbi:DUF2169 family type VI secretion system accessory protein [Sorangium sp. So ce362]|uniref:DUF2169 family type VI secretion system accessory protein n=1 Tax=Sorangium sp. So ce362 TaxID=3133303 RepID=UPI003F61E2F2
MFANATPYPAVDVPLTDPTGRDMVVVVVKASFQVRADGRVIPAEEPSQLRTIDVPYDPENPRSSTRYPTDICLVKGGVDVIVVGEAISPKPVTVMDVAVKARDLNAPLRVHGTRLFYRRLAGLVIGPAAPFERMPIVYENAYGGASEDWTEMEPRNWAGVGVAARESDLEGSRAPQIEHPLRPHKGAGDKHPPVGYGAIPPHWSPRRERAGTFDEAWQKTRMPLLPVDWHPRANNAAHPSLLLEGPLLPGDPIGVLGMCDNGGLLAFEIPPLPLVIRARFELSGKRAVRPAADTLLIEPGKRRFELVVRQAFPMGRGRDVLRELVADVDH